MIPLLFVLAVTLATIWLGVAATRKSKTVSDFFVAGRSVSVFWNASAISGEYLSAASFMGIAGLIMKNGYDALWYPVGYAAGYLFLLLFIAGPLRRFGAYTIPDFAQGRFDSAGFRKLAVLFVLFIGFFYTMPQMKGAGITMMSIMGWPYWVGIAVVGTVITFNVALGGMKGITLVQAFQYWVKVFAIAAPLFVILALLGHGTPESATQHPKSGLPTLDSTKAIEVKGEAAAPNNAISTPASESTLIELGKGAQIAKVSPARKPKPGEDEILASALLRSPNPAVDSGLGEWPEYDRQFDIGPATTADSTFVVVRPQPVMAGGHPVIEDGKPVMTGARIEFKTPSSLHFHPLSYGAYRPSPDHETEAAERPAAPNAPPDSKWLNPFGPMAGKWGYPLLYTYSLIIALVCGTAGLPHILVRFYTNPDGRAARRTTLWVMVLLGLFYVFTPVWGTVGRALMPELYTSNNTDSAVIKLPTLLQNETLGLILSGITSAGAFAAFMSTFSGLLVSMSGAFAHDVYGRILRPDATSEQRLLAFKVAAIGVGAISMGLGLLVQGFDIAMMVGWAFAIGAASYFPLLLLGSWWRGLTKTGAATGMLLGGLLSLLAIVSSMLLDKKVIDWDVSPLTRSLMEQPAIWGVPLSLCVMFVVSKATASSIPSDVDLKMLRLHAPEELGLSKNYVE
jgi:Na+(H+)/acetate symporter ActP